MHAHTHTHTHHAVIADYLLEQQQMHDQDKEVVITLTGDNFDPIVATADLILVEFYADWYVQYYKYN